MKYGIPYRPDSPFKYYDRQDVQLIVYFNQADNTLPEFLDKFSNHTVIIALDSMAKTKTYNAAFFKELYKQHPNFMIRFDGTREELRTSVIESGVPFCFSTLVDNYDTFWGLLQFHPKYLYIVNQMGFQLKRIGTLAHQYGTGIRVMPNRAQSHFFETPAVKQFWIQPADLHIYAPYVDAFEFWGDLGAQSGFYTMYHDQSWFGDLSEIIAGLNISLDGRTLFPSFGERRLNCGKKCTKGNNCNVCQTLVSISNSMRQAGFIINPKARIKTTT